ncbi:hypothetical protein [Solibacillus sp. FSL H8-0538]|uniref:hypothetical protein n=1 Tax=Solibacillus sp. FSL H8-0538 TaxID=2921400 RepID=UPI0030F5168A
MEQNEQRNNARAWLVIGGIIAIIGLGFTIAMSVIYNKQIDLLVTNCESEGGQAIVEKGGFIVTTSYQFNCEK